MTLGEWLRLAANELAASGVESPYLEAQVIAAHALNVDRAYVLTHPEIEVAGPGAATHLARRVSGEPLAYILGWREFYGRRFSVSPAVLIPRQDTEVLIEAVLARFSMDSSLRVLDVGTGSGVIAITLKLERPNWQIAATDISEQALEVARANAVTHGAEVEFHHADLIPTDADEYDVIVSNPPYVALGDEIGPGVEHEPNEALYAGQDGLDIYRRLAILDAPHLFLEVGQGQAPGVADLFNNYASQFHKDLAGIDRVVELTRQP